MEFLDNFDSQCDSEQTKLLRDWIESQQDELFTELQQQRSILKFPRANFGSSPNSPADKLCCEELSSSAFLLTDKEDIEFALQHMSIKPYGRNAFVLTIDTDEVKRDYPCPEQKPKGPREHCVKKDNMLRVAHDVRLGYTIEDAIRETINIHLNVPPQKSATGYTNDLDIYRLFYDVALRFTGKHFGIDEAYVFGPTVLTPQSAQTQTEEHSAEQHKHEKPGNFNFHHCRKEKSKPYQVSKLEKHWRERRDKHGCEHQGGAHSDQAEKPNDENAFITLEDISSKAYDNFIWKIFAQYVYPQECQPTESVIDQLVAIVSAAIHHRKEEGLIPRFLLDHEGFKPYSPSTDDIPQNQELLGEIVGNILGMIQGLVPNIVVSGCIAYNQLLQNAELMQEFRDNLGNLDKLKELVVQAHLADAPSPFLPRYGRLQDLPSLAKLGESERQARLRQFKLEGEELNKGQIFLLAIGAGFTSPTTDIRMGVGSRLCMGQDMGDEIVARVLSWLVQIENIEVTKPLSKEWAWKIKEFNIAGETINLNRKLTSKQLVNYYAHLVPPRPRAISMWSHLPTSSETNDYASWESLRNKDFTGRHLPEDQHFDPDTLPVDTTYVNPYDYGEVTGLFKRDTFQPCSRSNALFTFFAQWITDSFLRTNLQDRRRNTSNHQIDMCQLYGLQESTTDILRSKQGGRMKSHFTQDGGEFPPLLFRDHGVIKEEFAELPYVKNGMYLKIINKKPKPDLVKPGYFATGLERGNVICGYSALSTLFLREHNRLCKQLQLNNPSWDDERLFQTARNIVIAMEIKIIIEDYINHISSPNSKPFVFDQSYAETEYWYRDNWITLEFDLLYRWHCLIGDSFDIDGQEHNMGALVLNNDILMNKGMEKILVSASKSRAGKAVLGNTPNFMLETEYLAIKMGRTYKVRSYNDYRQHFGLNRLTSFSGLANADKLESLYKDIDKLEFIVGIYAEQPSRGSIFGQLMTRMVAYDAFTHALSNPLLSNNLWNRDTFTDYGLEQINKTGSLNSMLQRNSRGEVEDISFAMI